MAVSRRLILGLFLTALMVGCVVPTPTPTPVTPEPSTAAYEVPIRIFLGDRELFVGQGLAYARAVVYQDDQKISIWFQIMVDEVGVPTQDALFNEPLFVAVPQGLIGPWPAGNALPDQLATVWNDNAGWWYGSAHAEWKSRNGLWGLIVYVDESWGHEDETQFHQASKSPVTGRWPSLGNKVIKINADLPR